MDKLSYEEKINTAYLSLADSQRLLLRAAHKGRLSHDAAADIVHACERVAEIAKRLAAVQTSVSGE